MIHMYIISQLTPCAFSKAQKNRLLFSPKGERKRSAFHLGIEIPSFSVLFHKPANFDPDQVNSFSANSVLEDKLKTPPETAFNLIATIGIPSVNLNVPIYNGVDNWNLTYGAGTFSPDQKLGEGNYALASHRATVPNLLFTPLERLNMGEGIFVTDKNKVYEYIATTRKQVLPSQSEVLDVVKGKKLITLVTCSDDYGTARLIIQGELSRVWDVDKAPKEVLSYLNGEKTTY